MIGGTHRLVVPVYSFIYASAERTYESDVLRRSIETYICPSSTSFRFRFKKYCLNVEFVDETQRTTRPVRVHRRASVY